MLVELKSALVSCTHNIILHESSPLNPKNSTCRNDHTQTVYFQPPNLHSVPYNIR